MPENPPAPPVQPPITPPSPSSPPPANEKEVRMWNMICHLSALSMCVGVPFGNVLGPLLIWQIKKNEMPSIEVHGKAAVNFQLTVLIAALASVIVGAILMFLCIGVVFFFVAGGIGICGLVFAVIAGLKANEGSEYTYPFSLNLIK